MIMLLSSFVAFAADAAPEEVPFSRELSGLQKTSLLQLAVSAINARVAGNYELAAQLVEESLRMYKEAGGPDDMLVANKLTDLAILYQFQGKYEGATTAIQRSLEIQEKHLGKDHLNLAEGLDLLALIHLRRGDYDRAFPLFHRSVGIRLKALANDRSEILPALLGLALLHRHVEQPELASEFVRRAEDIAGKVSSDAPFGGLVEGALTIGSAFRNLDVQPFKKLSLSPKLELAILLSDKNRNFPPRDYYQRVIILRRCLLAGC